MSANTSLEVQLERMDSKLEKHIGVTETILRNQERTLEEIKNIVGSHDEKFLTREDAEYMESVAFLRAKDEINKELQGFETRLDKKYRVIGSVIVIGITIVLALIEIWPLII